MLNAVFRGFFVTYFGLAICTCQHEHNFFGKHEYQFNIAYQSTIVVNYVTHKQNYNNNIYKNK